jgi:hypothetical protein
MSKSLAVNVVVGIVIYLTPLVFVEIVYAGVIPVSEKVPC